MMKYSTFSSVVKSVTLLAVFQLSYVHFAFSQGCAPSITAGCATPGFLTVNGDFDSTPEGQDCPATITVSDGTNSLVLNRGGGCQNNGPESYFASNTLDCAVTEITITVPGAGDCDYDTPGGIAGTHALPVELGSFSAKINDGKITLRWTTYTELNNDYFSIEKSTDGVHFEIIAEESGAGTTFEENQYSFTDNEPTDGMNYYRLSQTDFDGASETFSVLSVDVNPIGNDHLQIFPNPTSGFVNLAFSDALLEKQTTINLYDLSGKLVQSQELFLEDSLVRLDLENIPQGMYFVTAQAGRQFLRKKLSIY